ncbi:MAG: esterase family protein [Bacteroidaceae bacterium]|nr:esterase family protein [Bacteroidaceae bacterium]
MKRNLTLICLLTCTLMSWAGRIVTDSIQSKVLNATVKFNVYLPSDFDKSKEKLPVVYLLHGLTDTYTAWEQKGGMKDITDEIIGCGEAVPMVIIMPNAGGPDVNNTWNGYFNMPGWAYEDFFFKELLPTAEKRYRCTGDKAHRAIMGLSMGGGGSVGYCQRHPDMFSSCYAMSPWLNSGDGRLGPNGEKTKMYYTSEAVKEHSALAFMDRANDATKEQLSTLKWFLDCGDDDWLLGDTFELYKKMRMAKLNTEFRVRNGVHNWEYWRAALRLSLPFASRNFAK